MKRRDALKNLSWAAAAWPAAPNVRAAGARRPAAAAAYLEVLEPFEGADIDVVLMRSLIRDGGT